MNITKDMITWNESKVPYYVTSLKSDESGDEDSLPDFAHDVEIIGTLRVSCSQVLPYKVLRDEDSQKDSCKQRLVSKIHNQLYGDIMERLSLLLHQARLEGNGNMIVGIKELIHDINDHV